MLMKEMEWLSLTWITELGGTSVHTQLSVLLFNHLCDAVEVFVVVD